MRKEALSWQLETWETVTRKLSMVIEINLCSSHSPPPPPLNLFAFLCEMLLNKHFRSFMVWTIVRRISPLVSKRSLFLFFVQSSSELSRQLFLLIPRRFFLSFRVWCTTRTTRSQKTDPCQPSARRRTLNCDSARELCSAKVTWQPSTNCTNAGRINMWTSYRKSYRMKRWKSEGMKGN